MSQFSKQGGGVRGPAQASTSSRSLEEIQADIDDLTENVSCSDNSQCQVIGYGSRCGGPSRYQIYALDQADPNKSNKVDLLASEYTRAEENAGTLGTCSADMHTQDFLEAPAIGCVTGGCAELP
jgi:hypothetical protein